MGIERTGGVVERDEEPCDRERCCALCHGVRPAVVNFRPEPDGSIVNAGCEDAMAIPGHLLGHRRQGPVGIVRELPLRLDRT